MTGGCGDCMLIKYLQLVVLIFFLLSGNQQNIADDNNVICRQDVPLKVNFSIRRLLRNRLPTKDNLIKRVVISTNVKSCVGGCVNPENASHLFLHCGYFCQLWIVVYDWLHFFMVTRSYLSYHLSRFSVLRGFSKYKRNLLQLICLSTIWDISKERNAKIFKNKKILSTTCLAKFRMSGGRRNRSTLLLVTYVVDQSSFMLLISI